MLTVHNITAGYGQGTVLHAVTITIATATTHTLVGPNGAGKTTLLHTIAGLLPARTGTIHLSGHALHGQPAHRIARAGVALVPQSRRVFASLTVAEHLAIASRRRGGPWTPARILTLLRPLRPLQHRIGRHLSGGQQQMLAIARALATNPTLLLLDEPTEGLAPDLVDTVHHLLPLLASEGTTILITTSNTNEVATTSTAISNGRTTAVPELSPGSPA